MTPRRLRRLRYSYFRHGYDKGWLDGWKEHERREAS